MKNKSGSRKRKHDEKSQQNEFCAETSINRIKEAYDYLERRQVVPGAKNYEHLELLGGIYAAQMLKYTEKPDDIEDMDEMEDDASRRYRILKLPEDGGIFHDGLPFHHFAMVPLKEKHLKRLKKHGIEIKQKKFSKAEDNTIRENWTSFAAAHNLSEEEAPLYMGAATTTETFDDHKERIKFIRENNFRPWICSKLLNRTAIQVFRRCYHLYRVSNLDNVDFRKWTPEDDKKLLELVEKHGQAWEYIGNELFHTRYGCLGRYNRLTGVEEENKEDWDNVEVARLYNYLADHLPRNPVMIAVIPKYQNLDAHVDWSSAEFRLPKRTANERKQKWEQLKAEFRNAKEQMNLETIKQILRQVIPEDTKILARATAEDPESKKKKRNLIPIRLAEDIALLRQFCVEHGIEKARDIRPEELNSTFTEAGKTGYSVKHFLKRVKYLLFVGQKINLFSMLDIEQDNLNVRLEMWSFMLQKVEKTAKIKKKHLRKYARKFVRSQGWEPKRRIVLVRRRPKETKENEYDDDAHRSDLISLMKLKKWIQEEDE